MADKKRKTRGSTVSAVTPKKTVSGRTSVRVATSPTSTPASTRKSSTRTGTKATPASSTARAVSNSGTRSKTPTKTGGNATRVTPSRGTTGGRGSNSTPSTGIEAANREAQAVRQTGIWDLFESLSPRPATLTLRARRPDDLLVFDLRVTNLEIAADQPPRLVRKNATKTAAIILDFQPQHFGEQAFLDGTAPEVPADDANAPFPETSDQVQKNTAVVAPEPIGPLPAVKIRMAGKSRLAFTMPDDVDALTLSVEAILAACRDWAPRLSPLAAPLPRPEFTFGLAEQFESVLTSPGWQNANVVAEEAIAAAVPARAASAIRGAATRLAKRLKTDLAGSRVTRTLTSTLKKEVERETASLVERYPALREPDTLEATQIALALKVSSDVGTVSEIDKSALSDIFDAIQKILAPHNPPPDVTALELPYRLITSPLAISGWNHSDEAITRHGRTELWHTRLHTTTSSGQEKPSPIRGIWSPDYDYQTQTLMGLVNSNPPKPFRMSLDALDRVMLVKLMAGFNLKENGPRPPWYLPLPAYADRLMLTALGGLLDSEGNWDYRHLPPGVGLEQWRHLAAVGRDQYVRVVYRGYLYPFGHSASLIKVTERKFESVGNDVNKRVAVLRQRFFIVVRERERPYDGTGHEFKGRNFPFTNIRINTRVTPNLKPPEQSAATPAPGQPLFSVLPKRACFWPTLLGGGDFEFDITETGIDGVQNSFSMPLMFVGLEVNSSDAPMQPQVLAAYNHAPEMKRSTSFDGNSLCYAPLPEDPQAEGDPRLPTGTLVFRGAENSAATHLDAHVYPVIEHADVGIRAVQKMLGDPLAEINVVYPPLYLQQGFTASSNPGEVFLNASSPYDMAFGESGSKSDSLGAIAAPSMAIAGLSRQIGPTGDPDAVATNDFNPLAYFKDAKILGGISVADLLQGALGLTDAPRMLSRELPSHLEASFNWQTTISHSDPAGIFVHSAGGTTTFVMTGTAITPYDNPSGTTYSSAATLVNFKINLFDFITLWFDRLEFTSKTGSKADVVVDLNPQNPVAFGGPLKFINQLSEIIPMDGFSDPPNIDVTPSGLSASYSLAIPSIQVGIFALTNMSIGAGFSLPFNNEPMQVRFNFSERENPFSLTVSLFGGGGFFALGIGTEGVNEIEAALEFGAGISIDLGVASGGVEVKGGVYFHWKTDLVELTGYVRLHGELSIIGLISASLTFNLQLSYLKEGSKTLVWGEASLIIEIEVLVFSGSVTAHCRREFAGSEADPTFLDLMPETTMWDDYCGAFADEEAA